MTISAAIEQSPWPESIDVAATEYCGSPQWHDMFTHLRATSPVHYCRESFYGPYWSVTTHQDIIYVEALPELYSSAWQRGGVTVLENDLDIQLPMFIAMDRPKHTAQRRVVAPAFGRSELLRLSGAIRKRTADLLDNLPFDEPFDWVRNVSTELTSQMLATLFDVPLEDRHRLADWANWAGEFRVAVSPALRRKRQRKLQEMTDYFGELWQARQNAGKGPDLLSRMIFSDGMSNMRPQEFAGNLMLLLIGGMDTTRQTMTGLVVAKNQFPGEWDRLRQDDSLIADAVSELLRWQTPLAHMRRTATEDTELGGKLIRAGDKIVLWYISANRDERVFEDGARFDVGRPNARRHLSFGYGIHRCVGSKLAELQLYILIEEMLRRGMNVKTLTAPERIPSPFTNGYRKQMVRITRF